MEMPVKELHKKAFILLFTRKQLPVIINKLGMTVKRRKIVYKKTGEVVRCHICDRELTVDNIGAIFPGKVICDDICCYSEYLVEKKSPQRSRLTAEALG
jgi:hypothetical protein